MTQNFSKKEAEAVNNGKIIETGKAATLLIYNSRLRLMKGSEKDILSTQILMTFVNGEKVYEKNQ